MFKCPYCETTKESDTCLDGKPRRTCGAKSCSNKFHNAKYEKAEKEEYACPYCKKVKMVRRFTDRKTCGERECLNKYTNEQRKLDRPIEPKIVKKFVPAIRKPVELTIEELKELYPYFYSLVSTPKIAKRSCLKCGKDCFGDRGYRICASCRPTLATYGARVVLS
jgi:hypothetical protein